METTKAVKDSNSKAYVLLYNLASEKTDTMMRGLNDSKNFAFDEDGKQLAAAQKHYKSFTNFGTTQT